MKDSRIGIHYNPPLPRGRVACERGLSYCGIDYAGPVLIKTFMEVTFVCPNHGFILLNALAG